MRTCTTDGELATLSKVGVCGMLAAQQHARGSGRRHVRGSGTGMRAGMCSVASERLVLGSLAAWQERGRLLATDGQLR
ncbi:hypothetical protein PR202_gb24108 [Eleusine coracana subsp. coracana]|uniref:Uncharacterized protein n=1 Tax=Eleusine coracana subsp. coracana TaxID=191504 RepID=A0AAV5FLL2_ELECO|nr:hypothetical protein PR202_gb24108 [Eleusine coracana subsp. coracana]